MADLKTVNGLSCEQIKTILLNRVDQLKQFIELHITCDEVTTTTTTMAEEQLLLDLYPDAAVAYSLRKLKSDYAGNCIKVRRSSDDATQDIGFSGNVLDETALTTFVGAGDGFIHTWYDQSTNGNNLTQTVNGNQPKIVSGGTVITDNTKPCVQLISASSNWLNLDSPVEGNSDYSAFSVDHRISGFSIVLATSVTTQPYTLFQTGGASIMANTVIANNYIEALTEQALFSCLSISATNYMYKNGVSRVLASMGGAYDNDFNYLGRRGINYSNSYIQECILYLTDKSSDRSDIETNINDFYSIY